MKALVTGGAGYIGSIVSNYLLDKGHHVTIIDNVKFLNKIFIKNKFDVVFHFAAYINNEESLKFPKKYYNNNYKKGKIFFDNCIKNNINKFIYSSTAAVYGNKNKKVTENDKLKPMSAYSKSKLKLEKYLIKKRKKIRCVILRYINIKTRSQLFF